MSGSNSNVAQEIIPHDIQTHSQTQDQNISASSPNDVQIVIKEAYKDKSSNFLSFFDGFTQEYKLIKKITHECQVKCYSNEKSNTKESEQCARSCLKPYLTFKKITGDKLQKCEVKIQRNKC